MREREEEAMNAELGEDFCVGGGETDEKTVEMQTPWSTSAEGIEL